MEKKLLGLYVHIPFCERKCDYCNFVSFCMSDSKKTEYVSALIKEIELQAKLYADYSVDTIFIGGGTPTTLPAGEISKILFAIKQNFDVQKNCEISIECNPNSLTLEKLKEYKDVGITRLSVGLQAYNNRLLKLIGRLHNKKQFNYAIKNAKACGFENINVDLILGLPTQKMHHIKKELKQLTKLGIKH
ncbi:MAG: radical SAM protein, partial [Clostridia bacterium]|nr:radical SAM protein [Clostridia bacterium]